MSSLIDTSTLVDIARHKNKLIRLSMLMEKMSANFLVGKMAYIFSDSDPVDLVLALDDDLNASVKMIKAISLIVDSVDENGVSLELGEGDNDLNILFPELWDNKSQTLTIFNHQIRRGGGDSSKKIDEIKKPLYLRVMEAVKDDFSFEDYKKHVSLLKNVSNGGKPQPSAPYVDVFKYCSQLAAVKVWAPFYEAAAVLNGDFRDFRRSLSDKQRRVVDEKVYSGRAMIDGVVKTSTYITKNGSEQISTHHKKHTQMIEALEKMVSNTPFLAGVELDQDTDIEKFHDVLVDICSLKLDFSEPFELKSRKLGLYKSSGINLVKGTPTPEFGFASFQLRIVAIDVTSPTSTAHELAHYRDVVDDDVRAKMVSHFSEKMDTDAIYSLYPNMLGYFLSDREVVARMGEIGFLLNQYNYQDSESMTDFAKRVRAESHFLNEDGKSRFNVNLTKDIDHYLGNNDPLSKYIYFDMAEWEPKETALLRDYTRGFFYGANPELTRSVQDRVDSGVLIFSSKQYQNYKNANRSRNLKARGLSTKEELIIAYGKVNPNEFLHIYQEGIRSGLLQDGEFIRYLSERSIDLFSNAGRHGKKRGSFELITAQVNSLLELSKIIDSDMRPGDALLLEEFALNYSIKTGAIKSGELLEYKEGLDFHPILKSAGQTAYNSFWDFDRAQRVSSPYTHPKLGHHVWNISGAKYAADSRAIQIFEVLKEFSKQAVLNVRDINTKKLKVNVGNVNERTYEPVKWLAVSNLFNESFSKIDSLPPAEPTRNWQSTQVDIQRTQSIAAIKDSRRLADVMSRAGLSNYFSLPKLRAEAFELEFKVVEMLLDDNLLEDCSITNEKLVNAVGEHCQRDTDLPNIDDVGNKEFFLAWTEMQREDGAFKLPEKSSRAYFKELLRNPTSVINSNSEEKKEATSPLRLLLLVASEQIEDKKFPELFSRVVDVFDKSNGLDPLVDTHLEANQLDFNRVRLAGFSDPTSNTGMALNHPWSLFFDKFLLTSDSSGPAKTVYGNDLFKAMVKTAFVTSVFDDSINGELNLIHAHSSSGYGQPFAISLHEGECLESSNAMGAEFSAIFVKDIASRLPAPNVNPNLSESFVESTANDRALAREDVNHFLKAAVSICPETTALFLKSTMMFSSPDIHWEVKEGVASSIDAFCSRAKYVSLPLLEAESYYSNITQLVDKVAMGYELEEPEAYKPAPAMERVNENVPCADGDVLRPRNQLSLFS